MPDEPINPNQPPAADPSAKPDGQGNNPADQPKGADTPPANPLEAKAEPKPADTDVTLTPEFKAALTAAITAKLPQLQKQARAAVAKELSGEKEGEPTIEQLKTQITERDSRLRILEAKDQLETFVSDKRNQIQAGNLRGLFKYIKDDLQFDDEGKVTNFKEVLAQAKAEAPELFRGISSSIDAGNGARQAPAADMNAWMRGGTALK
jgi:uncharacterized phage infection (PIP) family protein YhgE